MRVTVQSLHGDPLIEEYEVLCQNPVQAAEIVAEVYERQGPYRVVIEKGHAIKVVVERRVSWVGRNA